MYNNIEKNEFSLTLCNNQYLIILIPVRKIKLRSCYSNVQFLQLQQIYLQKSVFLYLLKEVLLPQYKFFAT